MQKVPESDSQEKALEAAAWASSGLIHPFEHNNALTRAHYTGFKLGAHWAFDKVAVTFLELKKELNRRANEERERAGKILETLNNKNLKDPQEFLTIVMWESTQRLRVYDDILCLMEDISI